MILGSGLLQAANTFVGAYDAIPSIAAAYSTRRLLSSYTGPLLRLVADRTGYPEQDIGFTAAGDLDTAAAASFLSGDTGYVTKLYDQSNNMRDAVQAALANMPLYVASGQNSKPVLQFSSLDFLGNASVSMALTAQSVVVTFVPRAGGQPYSRVFAQSIGVGGDYGAVGHYVPILRNVSTESFGAYASSGVRSIVSLANGTAGVISAVHSGSGITNYINGSTASPYSHTLNATFTRIYIGDSPDSADGGAAMDLCEMIICSSALSTSNRNAAESAANVYWSVY